MVWDFKEEGDVHGDGETKCFGEQRLLALQRQ